MKVVHWIAIAVLVKTVTVIGDYSLQISLNSFSNPEKRNSGGSCCVRNDTSPLEGVCPGDCNTTMWFCVQDIDTLPNDFTCIVGMGLIPQSLSSLIIFSQGAWPGSVQLDIFVIDDQSETLGVLVPGSPIPPGDLIDVAYINNITVEASAPQSPPREFNGNLSRVTVSLSFQVICAVNFFGPDCNTFCQGRDSALGHFTCDPLTGNRVCLPGYRNVSVDCTECVPLEGCSSIGGFCVDPGECICRNGYFGELCINRSSLITPSATTTPPVMMSSLEGDISSPPSPSNDLMILTSTSSVSVVANPNPFTGASVTLALLSTTSTVVLQIPQPTGVSGGGLGARTSNTAIVWISVSVTVGLSVFTAVAVIVFAAAVYSHRKGQVPQKKRKTGSQFFSLIYNANANNHSSADTIPETRNNARGIENENVYAQTNGTLTAESRDIIPEATYSTFQDNGHYSIKLLTSEDELDSEEQILKTSVFPNCEAEQIETSSKKKDYFVPKLNSYDDTMEVKGELLEPDFRLVTNESSFGFHNEPEQNVGGNLLSCIEETLSHSTQANNDFPGMIAALPHSSDNMTEEKLTVESGFETSFIYADHVDGGPDHDAVDCYDNELRLPSISPDSTHA